MGPGPGGGKIRNRFAPERNDIRSILGAAGHYIINLTGATGPVAVPEAFQQCRWYEVDEGGPIRLRYNTDADESYTVTLAAFEGANDQYPNIDLVYPTLADGSTPCSCKVYDDATGQLINGIRLVM